VSEAYRVGVAIALSSNATQVFGALGQHFLGLNKHLMNFQNNWKKTAALVGGGLGILGGVAVLKGAAKLVEHGNELVKIQRDMAQAGVSATQIQEAYAKAWQMTGKYQNMSAVEVLKMVNDARMTFGDQDSATHHIEDFVQMAGFLKAYQGGAHAGKSETLLREVNAAMKSGEIAGKITPEDMAEHVKQLTAMKVAYGEQLKVSQYQPAQRAAGVALRNSSDAFRYGMFPALVQENGVNAGTMLMTAFNKVVAGTGNRTKSLEHMREIGLLKEDQIEYDKVGRAKGLKSPDGIKGSYEAAMNFGDWVMNTLKPKLDAQTTDPIKQAQLISGMFPDRNAAKAITEIIQQYRKLAKDAEQMAKARAAMDAAGYTAGSWDYQLQAFKTQWTNLLDALGAPMVKNATEMLAKLNQSMVGFSQWAGRPENADTVRNIVTGFAALGAFLVGGGAIAILSAIGPAGWLVGGLAALAVAATRPGFKDWLKSTSISDSISKWMQGHELSDMLKAVGSKLAEGIMAIGKAVNGAIDGAISAINSAASKIAAAIAGLGSAIAGAAAGIAKGGAGGAGGNYDPMGNPTGQPMNHRAPAAGPAAVTPVHHYTPPPRTGGGTTQAVNLYIGREKIGRAVLASIVDQASGPIQGSAYPDATRRQARNDHAYIV
jgi:hypothetical protein